ncbi:hypothetical protein [Candidatus Nitrosotenuis cloacae]|uniref:Uncharacterized protein n=1 Tax=Candidatus Nitrosotenuis cloacae TaxID=1603555 RepID=A0A3G1B174_9ARCH|nr:hypothetical protein [Candidatus Nitrosotenuis cloacae]AJZ75882.1 hypothetical protein SU86_005325 [Candidatus Nitrosotenuis cloacae]
MILQNILLQIGNIEISGIIDLAIMVFSLLLLSLSLIAFKNTGLKKILYAAGAFGLFAVSLFLEYAEESTDFLGGIDIDFVGSAITLGILILFFIAIVKRR